MGTPAELKGQHMKGQILMIECEPLGPALEALQTAPGVLDAAVFGNGIHAVVADAAAMAPKIRELLFSRQFRAGRIEQIVPSLEDVFVALTASRGVSKEVPA
jgi:ABC-2 type transport system ATP-binding protein